MLARGLHEDVMRPILPGPHDLHENEIVADPEGYPIVAQKLFLLDVGLPEEEVERLYPNVWSYLQSGRDRGVHKRYSCSRRSPWYSQEQRPPAPYLCAYMGRSSEEEIPLRFLLNHSRAVVPNIYLMLYPRPALATFLDDNYPARVALWGELNNIGADELARRDRVYGSIEGRLEPNELGSVPADRISRLFPDLTPDSAAQMTLFGGSTGESSESADDRIIDETNIDPPQRIDPQPARILPDFRTETTDG